MNKTKRIKIQNHKIKQIGSAF